MEVDEMETRMPELQKSRKRVKTKKRTEPYEERDDDENMSDSPCGSVPSTTETPGKETQLEDGSDSLSVIKKAVVVLTRLPEYKISALRPPTPQQFYSEDDSKTAKHAKNDTTRNNNSNNNEPGPIIISSAFAHCSNETTKVRPNLPEEELKVDMMVLARKRSMRWQRGKIVDIVTREDGRLKYKVSFEEKGKSLVSGHHIAFDTTPKLEQLYVGARVVVRCQDNKFRFRPGVLSELPSRKNRLRFLVFLDDHTPVYVGLPLFHLVCRPQENVLDDIPDSPHKSFMTQYLKDWPYPHLTQYRVGQALNVELNGSQQRCEVQVVDCSIMQVVFLESQQKEWIHRGSMRLEHMARFLEMKAEERNGDSD
ncbi:histone-lysine N-methyltransferase SETDB1-B-like isoform X2 [Epinephelus fuscoguttatus]|uniref:histone-lysine N-methyltransferase SETDB1-B-like isoform X2 n=1 Tax=Epinephelus fuscoguttatus TaxID=293821 RepID=UPI0020D1DB1F|nr:histone-lysine N-methyltransferase SETDB1-B-like isoform X2 [Epinephelus fuscoguttatus]